MEPEMKCPPLAAIRYVDGAECDALLSGVAHRLKADGRKLAGFVQVNERYDALCACDMTLGDLSSGQEIRISQRLGRYARGCRLDHGALAAAVGLAETGLASGADLLIINKFGKVEAAGGGFRPVIAAAIGSGVPVLVAVSETNLAAWTEFTGGEGAIIPALDHVVLDWLHDALPQRRAIA